MAENKTDIWMPLYIGDLIADTTDLSNDEFGAYMLLICAYWRRGAALPDDDDRLMRICRYSEEKWQKKKALLSSFFKIKDGFWAHDRIDKEILAAKQRKEVQMERTKAATEARRIKRDSKRDDIRDVERDVSRDDAKINNVTLSSSSSSSPSPISTSLKSQNTLNDKTSSCEEVVVAKNELGKVKVKVLSEPHKLIQAFVIAYEERVGTTPKVNWAQYTLQAKQLIKAAETQRKNPGEAVEYIESLLNNFFESNEPKWWDFPNFCQQFNKLQAQISVKQHSKQQKRFLDALLPEDGSRNE